MKKNESVKLSRVVEGGLMLAIAMILNMFPIAKWPQGGSITLGGYVPIIIYALRWGMGPGIILGMLYGGADLLKDPVIVSYLQVALDYFFAYGALGLAGLGRNSKTLKGENNIALYASIVLATAMRAVFGILSGVIFFKKYLNPKINPWIASAIYNGGYIIPNTIICIVVILIILKPIMQSRKAV